MSIRMGEVWESECIREAGERERESVCVCVCVNV